jgi:hypothetical protein
MTRKQRALVMLMKENTGCYAVKYSDKSWIKYRIVSSEKDNLSVAEHRTFRNLIKNELIEESTIDGISVFVLSEKGKNYKFKKLNENEK